MTRAANMASTMLAGLLLVLHLIYAADAQVVGFGKCRNNQVKPDFDLNQYLGAWYEIEKFPASFERGLKCGKAFYELKDNGHIRVLNRGIKVSSGAANDVVEGDAYAPDPNQPAKLKLKFFWWQPRGDYWVFDTDYSTYSVVYSCDNIFGLIKIEFAWILSRERSLDDDTRSAILRDMRRNGINTRHFKKADQTGCEALDD